MAEDSYSDHLGIIFSSDSNKNDKNDSNSSKSEPIKAKFNTKQIKQQEENLTLEDLNKILLDFSFEDEGKCKEPKKHKSDSRLPIFKDTKKKVSSNSKKTSKKENKRKKSTNIAFANNKNFSQANLANQTNSQEQYSFYKSKSMVNQSSQFSYVPTNLQSNSDPVINYSPNVPVFNQPFNFCLSPGAYNQCNPYNYFNQYPINNYFNTYSFHNQPLDSPSNILNKFFSQNNVRESIITAEGSKFLRDYIISIHEESQLNEALFKLLPFLSIIIPNKHGKEVFLVLAAKLKVHQRLIVWSKIASLVECLSSKLAYDSVYNLYQLIQSKQEELSIINYLKFKFSELCKLKYGSLLLKNILETFNDEAKYILISFIYERFTSLLECEYANILVFSFLSITDSKPIKIKEGFLLSILPMIPDLLVSEIGHKVLLHIIKKWSLKIWIHLEKIIMSDYLNLITNEFSQIVVEELFNLSLNKEERQYFSNYLLKLNSKQIEFMVKRKGGFRSLMVLIDYLNPEDKVTLKDIALQINLKSMKTYMKRYNKLLAALTPQNENEEKLS